MIRWEDKSWHTPRGELTKAPALRTLEQARADIAKRKLARRPLVPA